jgi:2-hydroxy-6-oxonona-2,4-dienedioate hydrolase
MNTNPRIIRIDHDAPTSKAAVKAEQRLFAQYGLDYKVHFVNLESPNLRVRVLEAGEGPPLLMMPGGSGDAWFFASLMAQLNGWRIIALNRPGGGLSDGIDHQQVDVQKLAVQTIKAVADTFDLERVPIICNSMGGLWSFWYALEHPERVSKLVQMGCPALILNTSAPFFMRLLSVPLIKHQIVKLMQPKDVDQALAGLRTQGSSQEDIDKMPRVGAEATYHFFNLPTYLDTWKTLISAMATVRGANPRYQLRAAQLECIECPVQLIWGDNDPFGNLDVARHVEAILPHASLYEMQCGHLPFLDKPEEVGKVIRSFLLESHEIVSFDATTEPNS